MRNATDEIMHETDCAECGMRMRRDVTRLARLCGIRIVLNATRLVILCGMQRNGEIQTVLNAECDEMDEILLTMDGTE